MTYEDLVRLAADLGVEGIDLTVYWLPKTGLNDYLLSLRSLAYRSGVDIYGIGTRVQLCQAAPEAQDAEVGKLKQWLDVADRLGARHVRIFGGSVPKGASDDQAVGWAGQTLKKCVAAAATRGFFLGIEDDGALTENSGRLVAIVKQAESPWAGINLDVGNFKSDAYNQIAACLPYATNMHFKTQVNAGREALDWDRLFRMVAPAYHGYVALEYEGGEPPRTAVPAVAAKLQAAVRKYAPA